MTPSAASRLGANVAIIANAGETALQAHLRANYSDGVLDADTGAAAKPEREADEVDKPRQVDADEDVDELLAKIGETRVAEACERLGWYDDEHEAI